MLLMLEDDADRVRRFTATLHAIDPDVRLFVWRDAQAMIREMGAHLSAARLISLDHDLEPIGGSGDPGDGLEVVKFLVAQPIVRPVIIHTSNRERSTWMAGEFDLAGWRHWRVAPLGDDWIEVDWRRRVRRLLKGPTRGSGVGNRDFRLRSVCVASPARSNTHAFTIELFSAKVRIVEPPCGFHDPVLAAPRELISSSVKSTAGGAMSHEQTIRIVRDTLCSVFAQVDSWFDRPEDLRGFKPASGGWSVDQVLEHVTLTNRFLMLTLGKWIGIAEQRARRGDPVPDGESDLDRLLVIGERGSFGWIRPEHMEPTGGPSSAEVRTTLHRQLGECLIQLERIGGGVGALCRVTMTVNALGKIDLYQWLFFLAQHARRHIQQLAVIEAEFRRRAG